MIFVYTAVSNRLHSIFKGKQKHFPVLYFQAGQLQGEQGTQDNQGFCL